MPTQDVKPPYWLQISEAAQTLAHTLLERYPAAFCAEPAAVRPLKIGIDRDIRQALDVTPKVVTEVHAPLYAAPCLSRGPGGAGRHACRSARPAGGAGGPGASADGAARLPPRQAGRRCASHAYASGHAACADQ